MRGAGKPKVNEDEKAANTARIIKIGIVCRPNRATMIFASQAAALVASIAEPRLTPTPNSISVPQPTRD